jgi:acyl carrier protein
LKQRDLAPWQAEAEPLPAGALQASIRDADGLPVPPEAIGRLHLRGTVDPFWAPTQLAGACDLHGRLRCLGPLRGQVLVNGRRLNLAVLTERLRAVRSVISLELTLLRQKDVRDAILATFSAENPQQARQSILAAVCDLHPWLATDFRFRAEKEDNVGCIDTGTAEGGLAQPTAPRTPAEAAILGAFIRVLGIEEAGPEDDFFELGGDSLRAFRALAEIKLRFGVEIPLMRFFENPTAAALSEIVIRLHVNADNGHTPAECVVAARDLAPLSYGQEQIWLAHQMNPSAAIYNVPFTIPLKRSVGTECLQRALNELLRRHDILRSTFFLQGATPVQLPSNTAKIKLEIEDLSDVPPKMRWEAERAAVEAEATRPFDLGNGPVLRARLFRFSPSDHSLMLTLHHIVCDGRSAEILRDEITALYNSFEAGLPSSLPGLPRQYADYCLAQRQRFTPARRRHLSRHWNRVLAGVPRVLNLPFSLERPAVRSNRGQVLEFELSQDVSGAVRTLAAAENATEVMVLLACFKVLLFRYTGIRTLVVGSAITDRTAEEDRNLIGYFANTVVLCTQLDGDITFREMLARVPPDAA